MKQIQRFLVVLALLISAKAEAQYVLVPDSNFRKWIKQNVDALAIVGDSLDTTNVNIVSRKNIVVNYNTQIRIFDGIQYFDSLQHLEASNLVLDTIQELPPLLTYLSLSACHLDILPEIPASVETLMASANNLTYLPTLPSQLKWLSVYLNNLDSLPILPAQLKKLEISNNFFDHVPDLPAGLNRLYIGYNNIHHFDSFPDSLTELSISDNPIDSFPVLPPLLRKLWCNNTVSCLPLLSDSIQYIDYDHCIPNRPINLQGNNEVCIPPTHYYEVTDSITGMCNDSVSLVGNFTSILWGNGSTSQTLYNQCPDTFNCTVISTENCYYSNTYIAGGVPQFSYQISNGCGSSYSSAWIYMSGGSPPYTFVYCGTTDTVNPNIALENVQTDGWGSDPTCFHYSDLGGNEGDLGVNFPVTGPPLYYIHEENATCPTSNDGYYYSVGYQAYFNDCEFSGYDLTPGIYQAICAYNINCVDTYEVHIGSVYSSCDSLLLDSIYMPTCGTCNGYITIDCNSFSYLNSLTDSLGNDINLNYYNGCFVSDSILCPGQTYYLYGDYFGSGVVETVHIPGLTDADFVYPGDANNDGTANNLDLLFMGVAFSDTGFMRCDTSITWDNKYSKDWTNVFADSTNHKHADCNGNGIINNEDTLAIIQNYGLTHQRPVNPQFIQGAPALAFDLPGSLSSNATYQVPVLLGDSATVADSIYGIAFSIAFDPSLIQSSSVSFTVDSNWLGSNGDDLIFINHNDSVNGNLEVGVTRTDHVNRSGNGSIGTLNFKTHSIAADQTVYFSSANSISIANDGTFKPVNASMDSTILQQMFVSNFVYIPDSNFRKWIKLKVDSLAIVGDSLDTTNVKVQALKAVRIDFPYAATIYDLEGIQYFINADSLIVPYCRVTLLDHFPPQLKYLYFGFRLNVLNNMPSSLREIVLYNDSLTFIGPLPDSLKSLMIDKSHLLSLPALPIGLISLIITNNAIAGVPPLPASLLYLYLKNNLIQMIDSFPSNLITLNLENNQLDSVPPFPPALESISLDHNQLVNLPALPFTLQSLKVNENDLSTMPTLPQSLVSLYCSGNDLTYLPPLPDSLQILDCSSNPLINLPALNSDLQELNCRNSVHCLPWLPASLTELYYTGCVPNRPPNLAEYYSLCVVEANYIDIPDSGMTVCNDSLIVSPTYASYLWNTGDTINYLDSICRGVYNCVLTDSLNCISNVQVNVTDTMLHLSATSGPEQSCYDYQSYVVDLTVTGGTPPYYYNWQSDDGSTTIEDSCTTCQDIFEIYFFDWWPECGYVKCIVTDAAGRIDSISKTVCPNYQPDVSYQAYSRPLCPGIPTGEIAFWSSVNNPSGPYVSVYETDLDTGHHIYTQNYGHNCTAVWDHYLTPRFNDCNDAYSFSVVNPDCDCNGSVTFVNNCVHCSNASTSFDGVYLSDGTWVHANALCPGYMYYFYYLIETDNFMYYSLADSFYIPAVPGCSIVYPGDANNDGIVNNVDLLNIGVAYNDTGFARVDTTITFSAKPSNDWTTSFSNGLNHHYADCNGNGMVNNSDTLAIYSNYGLNHPLRPVSPFSIAGIPTLTIDLPPTMGDSQFVSIPVILGDSLNSIDSIYGLAFTINYDRSLIDYPIVFNGDSSWIGVRGNDLLNLQASFYWYGKLEASLVRTDHSNHNGNGVIGTLNFNLKNIAGMKKLFISISDVTAITKDENYLLINTGIDSSLINGCDIAASLLTSNSCLGWCDGSLQLQASNEIGSVHYTWSALQFDSTHCIPSFPDTNILSSLPTGTYQCIITDSVGCTDTISTAVISEISTFDVNAVTQREGCDSCDGYINLNIVGGYAPYVFAWDTAAQILGNNNFQQQNISSVCLNGANFICTVTDSLGCEKLYNEIFSDNNCLPANWIDSIAPECNNSSGYLNLTPLNPLNCSTYTGIFTFSPPGATIDYTQFPLVMVNPAPPGNYIYSFSSANGCDIDSVVYVIPYIDLSVVTIDPTCGWCNGIAVALINNDTLNNPGAIIQWSNDTIGLNASIDSFLCQHQQVHYFISSDGCELSSSFILDSCNLIQSVPLLETETQQFQILPNPNHGSFTLHLPQSNVSKSKIEIINSLGEIIYTGEMQKSEHKKEIKLTHFQSGLFTCRIISNDKVMQQKFVVE